MRILLFGFALLSCSIARSLHSDVPILTEEREQAYAKQIRAQYRDSGIPERAIEEFINLHLAVHSETAEEAERAEARIHEWTKQWIPVHKKMEREELIEKDIEALHKMDIPEGAIAEYREFAAISQFDEKVDEGVLDRIRSWHQRWLPVIKRYRNREESYGVLGFKTEADPKVSPEREQAITRHIHEQFRDSDIPEAAVEEYIDLNLARAHAETQVESEMCETRIEQWIDKWRNIKSKKEMEKYVETSCEELRTMEIPEDAIDEYREFTIRAMTGERNDEDRMRAWHNKWIPIIKRYREREQRIKHTKDFKKEAADKAALILEEASGVAAQLSRFLTAEDHPGRDAMMREYVSSLKDQQKELVMKALTDAGKEIAQKYEIPEQSFDEIFQ